MEPVVVVIRHPDFADDIRVFGTSARVVYLDEGSSFDVTKIGPEDKEDVEDWAAGIHAQVADLPVDHPARALVAAELNEVLDRVNE